MLKSLKYQVVAVLFVLVVVSGCVGFAFGGLVGVPVPAVPDLAPTAAKPYVFETPANGWDYFVGLYSNGSGFAVNGSNGDNYAVSSDLGTLIKNAIGYASSVHGSVCIGAGEYPILSQIDANFNNTVVYSDCGARLYLPDGQPHTAAAFRILYVNNCENFTIRGLVLDGNFQNNDYTGTDQPNLLMVRNSRHFKIEDNVVMNSRVNGIWIGVRGASEVCSDFKVVNNRVLDCKWNGINCYVEVDGGKIFGGLIADNFVQGSNDIGIDLAGYSGVHSVPFGVTVSRNIVDGYTTTPSGWGSGDDFYGIRTEGSRFCVYECNTVFNVNNAFADNPTWGDVGNNTVRNNNLWCNGSSPVSCIVVEGSRYQVYGNVIHTGYSAWTIGVDVVGDFNVVNGNYFYNDLALSNVYGIAVEVSGNWTVVMGNMFMNTFSDPLGDVVHSDAVFEHNYDVTSNVLVSSP